MKSKPMKSVGRRLFHLRYEDLIQNKNAVLRDVCRFLGRTTHVLPDKVQWHGKSFIANSSFTDVNKLFDKTPIGRWKTQWPWIGMLAHIHLGGLLKQAGYKTPC